MSKKTAHPDRDFSRFDSMSTQELKELLYQDSLLPTDAEQDMDAILYIMEVVAKREAQEHPDQVSSTEDAWASFNEHYRSEACDGTSLYEDADEELVPTLTVVPTPTIEQSKPRKKLRSLIRVACVAAAMVAILVGSSLIAHASGFDLWRTVAQWTQEVFGFTEKSVGVTPKNMYPADNDPRDTLETYGITVPLLPTWIPEGYSYSEIKVRETPSRRVFYVRYTNGTDIIGMTITVLSSTPVQSYEKDDQNTTQYNLNGIDHFIIKNLEETTIAWTVGDYECSIGGQISIEDAKQIIISIYRS